MITVTHAIEEAAILGQKILLLQEPPNIAPQIIENPAINTPNYRSTAAYQAVCQTLREGLQI